MIRFHNNVLLIRIIIIVVGVLLLFIAGLFTYNYFAYKSAPVLSVIVRNPSALIWGGENEYYLVRENGVSQKRSEFAPGETEAYRVDEKNGNSSAILIDSKSNNSVGNDSPLYKIALDIIESVHSQTDIANPDIYKIYVLEGRYFFDVFDDQPPFPSKFNNVIFEYLPNEGLIKETAIFHSKNVEHIELYR